jgi:hypothetical protein
MSLMARAVPAPAAQPASRPGLIQRCAGIDCPPGTCDHSDDPADATVHRVGDVTAASGGNGVPASVRRILDTPGRPLDASVRTQMQGLLGHDFSHVQLHTDAEADRSARHIQAQAYTFGSHVVMGEGRFQPHTPAGRRLLAHELAHVIQQDGPTRTRPMSISDPGDASELEAADCAQAAVGLMQHETRSGQPGTLGAVPPLAVATSTAPRGQLVQRDDGGQDMQVDEDAGAAGDTAAAVLDLGSAAYAYDTGADAGATTAAASSCTPAPGISNSVCGAYAANSWWLPMAYVKNATCACTTTPNLPKYQCIRKFLQDRLAAAPASLKSAAAARKPLEASPNPVDWVLYKQWVIDNLTPVIYRDHVDAYSSCCCPSGPADYEAWIGVTTVPPLSCDLVGLEIMVFGNCEGKRTEW